MSVEVDYKFHDHAFQDEEFQDWHWGPWAADARYWNFALIPEYGNVDVLEITRFWWSSDNEILPTAHFVIRAVASGRPGAAFGFKAIRAPSV